MASYTSALRIVGAFYAKRLLKLLAIVGFVVFALLIIGTGALATHVSSYWWLVLIFILPISLIVSIVLLLGYVAANTVQGRALSRSQRKLVGNFVDKVQSVVETTQFSFGFILFIITKDVLFHRNLQTLEKFIGDSTSLKRDLDTLRERL